MNPKTKCDCHEQRIQLRKQMFQWLVVALIPIGINALFNITKKPILDRLLNLSQAKSLSMYKRKSTGLPLGGLAFGGTEVPSQAHKIRSNRLS